MINLKIFEKFQKMQWISYCMSTVSDTYTTKDTFLGLSNLLKMSFFKGHTKFFFIQHTKR